MQRSEAGVRGAGARVRQGELEKYQRRRGRQENRSPPRHAESGVSRDSDTTLSGVQQSLHRSQAHVPGHRRLAPGSSCEVSMLRENAKGRKRKEIEMDLRDTDAD